MQKEDVIEWLRYPQILKKQYQELSEELNDLVYNPIHGVSYDSISTGRKTDLSDRLVKIEKKGYTGC